MAKELGKDWRLYVGDGAGTEAFDALGGEGSLEWGRQSDDLDFSDKDSGIYGSGGFGLQRITFNVSGNLTLPDDAFERLDTIAKSGNPILNVQIKKGAVVKYSGAVSVGNMSSSFPHDGPATFSFNMKNYGAPTVDDIGATS